VASNRVLADKLGVTFPILSDPAATTIRAYGVYDTDNAIAWPAVFIVGKGGAIEKRWLAEDYRVRITTAEMLSGL
jgi:peroxiredoxin